MPLPHASILFRPQIPIAPWTEGRLVEAPGTAPGSALLISHYVYRYSQPKLALSL